MDKKNDEQFFTASTIVELDAVAENNALFSENLMRATPELYY